jgi:uncharacterized protein (TIGR00299 family) protein
MKIAYFDCFAGASGDMILGSLLDAGVDFDTFITELAKLNLTGFKLAVSGLHRNHIGATSIDVEVEEKQPERHLSEIKDIINVSSLSATVKEKSIQIFTRLAEAEAKIHRTTPEKIHFHEVGGIDAIVDVVGAVIALELLEIEHVYVSAFPFGFGFVECSHGQIPMPAPAAIELLQGFKIIQRPIEGELVTPTGAAILSTLASPTEKLPEMSLKKIGYGAGKTKFPFPNLLRVFIGAAETAILPEFEYLTILEANIDDMNPEIYTYVFDLLFENGALDVFLTPIFMKKNRPGNMLSVLAPEEKIVALSDIIFRETSTFGLRQRKIQRRKLVREIEKVATQFGPIDVKIGKIEDKIVQVAPEFSDCAALARKTKRPLKEIYQQALLTFFQKTKE